jgi:multidrug efflux pump subunit AcrA (membrane-fusion protein)
MFQGLGSCAMTWRHMKNLFIILFALLIGAIANASTGPDKTPVVFTKKASLSDLFDELTYPARVESKINASIYSESDGVVSQIHAPLGVKVKPRSKLLVVKHVDPIYQFAPMTLYSPVHGTVSQVHVTEGSRVVKGQPLVSVTDPSRIRLLIEVAAQDLPSIKNGLQGEMKIPGTDKTLRVTVKGVSPFVDPGTGTASCQLEPDEPKASLVPGMVGQILFKVNMRKRFVFPEHAIVYKDKDTFMRVVRDGKSKNVTVTLGPKQRGMVEILSGLNPDDEVVERANGYIADGEAVRIEKEEKSGADKGG